MRPTHHSRQKSPLSISHCGRLSGRGAVVSCTERRSLLFRDDPAARGRSSQHYCRANAAGGACYFGKGGMMVNDPEIAELRRMIEGSRRMVIFTGAGISTESGIPDFRSPGGIWTKMRPIDFSEFVASDEARRETWRRRFASDATMRKAEPNRGHRAVATLVNRGTASAVITQNIDGLHQASGVPAERVIELHGNTTYAHCLDCAQRYEIEAIW